MKIKEHEQIVRAIVNTPSKVVASLKKGYYTHTEVLTLLTDRTGEILELITDVPEAKCSKCKKWFEDEMSDDCIKGFHLGICKRFERLE